MGFTLYAGVGTVQRIGCLVVASGGGAIELFAGRCWDRGIGRNPVYTFGDSLIEGSGFAITGCVSAGAYAIFCDTRRGYGATLSIG